MKAAILIGRSPKTVNNNRAILGRVLHYAVEIGVLDRAPRVKLLKVPPQKFDYLDDDEYARLLKAAEEEPDLRVAILVGGEAGLRRGEILALSRDDVDLRAGRITVRRSEWGGKLGAPKGGRERTIPLTNELARVLRAARRLRGPRVFCRLDGSKWTVDIMRKALPRVWRRAGLRSIGWHVLRHTFCSRLAMRGAPPKAIQELAGHTSMATTMKYMHLAPRTLNEAIRLLDAGAAWQNRAKTDEEGVPKT